MFFNDVVSIALLILLFFAYFWKLHRSALPIQQPKGFLRLTSISFPRPKEVLVLSDFLKARLGPGLKKRNVSKELDICRQFNAKAMRSSGSLIKEIKIDGSVPIMNIGNDFDKNDGSFSILYDEKFHSQDFSVAGPVCDITIATGDCGFIMLNKVIIRNLNIEGDPAQIDKNINLLMNNCWVSSIRNSAGKNHNVRISIKNSYVGVLQLEDAVCEELELVDSVFNYIGLRDGFEFKVKDSLFLDGVNICKDDFFGGAPTGVKNFRKIVDAKGDNKASDAIYAIEKRLARKKLYGVQRFIDYLYCISSNYGTDLGKLTNIIFFLMFYCWLLAQSFFELIEIKGFSKPSSFLDFYLQAFYVMIVNLLTPFSVLFASGSVVVNSILLRFVFL